jgi:beta-amylase
MRTLQHRSAILLSVLVSLLPIGCKKRNFHEIKSAGADIAPHQFTGNVMAPLGLGNLWNPAPYARSDEDKREWSDFREDLARAVKIGVHAVSVDFWWGVIQKDGPEKFDWRYYDLVVNEIEKAGLRWIPILSFHRAGGNVGDDRHHYPLPKWVFARYIGRHGISSERDVQYVSEDGNASNEYLSAWASSYYVKDFERFYRAFRDHYAKSSARIAEINISLGPAGELRYPSYNDHDRDSGWPHRGKIQAYSSLARNSFRKFVIEKYGSEQSATMKWGPEWKAMGGAPPKDVESFFAKGGQHGPYGKDFFDWYNQSLIDHGKVIVGAAADVFGEGDSPFAETELGVKLPGVHWRLGWDRLAELPAGLVRTSDPGFKDPRAGWGYASLINGIAEFRNHPRKPQIVLHFTCLEKSDREEWEESGSLAKSLVKSISELAASKDLPLKGENALAGPLSGEQAWKEMREAVTAPESHFSGLTILRMSDVTRNWEIGNRYTELIKAAEKSWSKRSSGGK